MAQGLEREAKGQSRGKDADEKISKYVRCSEGRVMGSRRIFPPQFKLQVLDSYRKDEDCKGNQRATARKYGIHRRQIQKWLQVEASLRTSVEVGSEQQQATPTTLNPTSASDAARQRDDGTGGGGGGESLQTAVPTCRPRGGEHELRCDPPDVIKLQEQRNFLHIFNEEYEDEEVEEEEEEDDEEDDDDEIVSEEDNMDSVPSVHNPDEALDFTCAALSKRRSFSLQFKLEVLNAFHADGVCHGNQRATARKFGINRRQVQKWLGQEVELRGEAAFRGGLYRQRLGRWLEMDDARKEENIPAAFSALMFDQYNANEQCWDLSSKKRKLEDDGPSDSGPRKRLVVDSDLPGEEDEVVRETRGVTSTNGALALDALRSAYGRQEEQETALCLVKVKADAEVTSSMDTHGFIHEPFLAAVPPPFHHINPLALPHAYDFYGFHCRVPCLQHLQGSKWFQPRTAAVPGYF